MQEYTIHRINLMNVNAFLVEAQGKLLLVDSGRKGADVLILKRMSQLGYPPSALKLLVLTHAHFDHAGSAAALQRATGCRVLVHETEQSRLQKGRTPMPRGTRWKARALVTAGLPFARFLLSYEGLSAAETFAGERDLESEGFPVRILHMPGHTPGSSVVLFPGGELLAGDSVFGLAGKELFPPYAEDRGALLASWEKLVRVPATRIFPAHGRPVDAHQLQEALEPAKVKYGV